MKDEEKPARALADAPCAGRKRMTDGLVMDMANLMAMRFGAFEFPVNPAELKVAHRALLRESIAPGGAEQVQRVGAYKRRVSGKGYFTGETAMADYLRLEALFGTVQTLFLPGRAPFEAVLSELAARRGGEAGRRLQLPVCRDRRRRRAFGPHL